VATSPLRRVSDIVAAIQKVRQGAKGGMKTFQLTRPKDSAQQCGDRKTKTAQQGADIRFIAGGTR